MPSPVRVLVVDDNEMNRDVLSRRLERQGYQVSIAEDGERALQVLAEAPFDLMLLDIMMPRMNGYEVLAYLKDNPTLREMPVIVISAVDELDSVVKCIELGAEDYLFEPFNPVLLKARVTACMEKKRLRDQSGLSPQDGAFLNSLMHDLDGSVNAIANGANALLAGGALTAQQLEVVRQILHHAQALAQRIDDAGH